MATEQQATVFASSAEMRARAVRVDEDHRGALECTLLKVGDAIRHFHDVDGEAFRVKIEHLPYLPTSLLRRKMKCPPAESYEGFWPRALNLRSTYDLPELRRFVRVFVHMQLIDIATRDVFLCADRSLFTRVPPAAFELLPPELFYYYFARQVYAVGSASMPERFQRSSLICRLVVNRPTVGAPRVDVTAAATAAAAAATNAGGVNAYFDLDDEEEEEGGEGGIEETIAKTGGAVRQFHDDGKDVRNLRLSHMQYLPPTFIRRVTRFAPEIFQDYWTRALRQHNTSSPKEMKRYARLLEHSLLIDTAFRDLFAVADSQIFTSFPQDALTLVPPEFLYLHFPFEIRSLGHTLSLPPHLHNHPRLRDLMTGNNAAMMMMTTTTTTTTTTQQEGKALEERRQRRQRGVRKKRTSSTTNVDKMDEEKKRKQKKKAMRSSTDGVAVSTAPVNLSPNEEEKKKEEEEEVVEVEGNEEISFEACVYELMRDV